MRECEHTSGEIGFWNSGAMAWQNSWFPALMFEYQDLLTGIAVKKRATSDLHRPVLIVVQKPGNGTTNNPPESAQDGFICLP